MKDIVVKKRRRLYALFNRETESLNFYTTFRGLYYACIPHFDKVPSFGHFRNQMNDMPKKDIGKCIAYHIPEINDTYNDGQPSKLKIWKK